MTPPGTRRITPKPCLRCGVPLNAIGMITEGDARGPQPGDPVVCIRCGGVMTMENGELRGFTDAEMDELTADAETMADLARMVQRVYLVRHGVN